MKLTPSAKYTHGGGGIFKPELRKNWPGACRFFPLRSHFAGADAEICCRVCALLTLSASGLTDFEHVCQLRPKANGPRLVVITAIRPNVNGPDAWHVIVNSLEWHPRLMHAVRERNSCVCAFCDALLYPIKAARCYAFIPALMYIGENIILNDDLTSVVGF